MKMAHDAYSFGRGMEFASSEHPLSSEGRKR